jgi:type IV secretion system protein VirB4
MAILSATSNVFLENASEYIPIASHYDQYSILTKNGELVQSIQIVGLSADSISERLMNLRDIIRNAIKTHVQQPNIACWMHTVRRRGNLDDQAPYPTLLSENIHESWRQKNFWHDRFVNTLYITFVTSAPELSFLKMGLLNIFSVQYIAEIYRTQLAESVVQLNELSEKMVQELSDFGAHRLGITYDEHNVPCSELLCFIRRIVCLCDKKIPLSEENLSTYIGSYKYAVGDDVIQIVSDKTEDQSDKIIKFASLLSIKEYQEVPTFALDNFLQAPVEFIVTEIFTFADIANIKKAVDNQNYIFTVSGDKDLKDQKGITEIMAADSSEMSFCMQQISVLIISDNVKNIAKSTQIASERLADIGLVHVREDINIENFFWAQIPGNFKFIRRASPISLSKIASLTSLHNVPAGYLKNCWGRANTILRTEKGTPYFFNLHDTNNNGNVMIVGFEESGKSVLMNFILSESMKYNPSILYFSDSNTSEIFATAQEGEWSKKFFAANPISLPCMDEALLSKVILHLSAIDSPTDVDIAGSQAIASFLMTLSPKKRTIDRISSFEWENKGYDKLQTALSYIIEGSECGKLLRKNVLSFDAPVTFGINHAYLSEKHMQLAQILVFTYAMQFIEKCEGNKIIVVDNMNLLFKNGIGSFLYDILLKEAHDKKCVLVSVLKYDHRDEFFSQEIWQKLNESTGTKIYLSSDNIDRTIEKKWKLSNNEFNKLKDIIPASRLFVIKQNNIAITVELSLGGFPGILKILSSSDHSIALLQKLIQEHGEEPEKWLVNLYETLSKER